MSFLNVILANVKEEFKNMMNSLRKSHFKEIVYRMLDLHLAREIEHYGPFIDKYVEFITGEQPKFSHEFTDGMIELCTRTRGHLMAILAAWQARARTKLPPAYVEVPGRVRRLSLDAFNEAVLAHYYYYELNVRIKHNLKPIFDGVKEDIEKVDEVKNVLEDANVSISVNDVQKLIEVWPGTLVRYPLRPN
jgi:hypothetical protein